MGFDDRLRIHAALADRHRLAAVDLLALGDRTPGELGERLGLPTNLLAHHLGLLEGAGLIERRSSAGDRRRRYVVLRPERLDGLISPRSIDASRPLFVCTANSARSQFAAAMWTTRTGAPADSAGAEPAAAVDPRAVRAARAFGLDLSRKRPKGYADVSRVPALVVSVCDRAREAASPFGPPGLHWSVADPVIAGDAAAFAAAFGEIAQRIDRLAAARAAA